MFSDKVNGVILILVHISSNPELSESPKLRQSKEKLQSSDYTILKLKHSQSSPNKTHSFTKTRPTLDTSIGMYEFARASIKITFESPLKQAKKKKIQEALKPFNFQYHSPNCFIDELEPKSQVVKIMQQLENQKGLKLSVKKQTSGSALDNGASLFQLSPNHFPSNYESSPSLGKISSTPEGKESEESEESTLTGCKNLQENESNEKDVLSVKQITSPFDHLFENSDELQLYQMSRLLPEEMIMNVSLHKDNGMRKIHLDVTRWNEKYQGKIQQLFQKVDSLFIRTETPETVLPWILQFPNLRLLDIDISEVTLKEESELMFDRKKISLDMEALKKIATFESLTILFSCDIYEDNKDIMRYLVQIFAQFKDKRKLRQLKISQYTTSLISKIDRCYKDAKANGEL
jgi:hypothetical protein